MVLVLNTFQFTSFIYSKWRDEIVSEMLNVNLLSSELTLCSK